MIKYFVFLGLISVAFYSCSSKSTDNNFFVQNLSDSNVVDTIPEPDSIPLMGRERFFSPDDSVSCRTLEVDMGAGKECLIRNADFSKVYYDIVTNNVIDEAKYMLSILPDKDQSLDLNKRDVRDGLITIKYTYKTPDHLIISLSYNTGSEIIIDMKALGNDVKRGIYHFSS